MTTLIESDADPVSDSGTAAVTVTASVPVPVSARGTAAETVTASAAVPVSVSGTAAVTVNDESSAVPLSVRLICGIADRSPCNCSGRTLGSMNGALNGGNGLGAAT